MKKLSVVLVMGAVLALAPRAMADQIFVGPGFGPFQTGSGGEFTLNVVNPNSWLDLTSYGVSTQNQALADGAVSSFQTFCIEENEFVSPDTLYNQTIDTAAIAGGDGGPHPDPISQGTGWLYSQFAAGTLPGYAYGAGRLVSADLLQKALWFLEGESGGAGQTTGNNAFLAAVATAFGDLTTAALDGGDTYGVFAMNLTRGTELDQSMLYYSTVGTTSVPDGGTTLLLLGMAMCALAIASRRFRRA